MTTVNFSLYNAGSTLVLDREMAGCFNEKKKKYERKREKKQARAMAIRQAKARCAASSMLHESSGVSKPLLQQIVALQ